MLEKKSFQEEDLIDKVIKKKPLSSSLRILIPLYITYTVFILSIFLMFIPQQEQQLLKQKKETIRYLTENIISLLSEINLEIEQEKITPESARQHAISHIRNLRYGSEGKDYFWINDMHPMMIMHPYRPDLEGQDLTFYKDAEGKYPFVDMVKKAAENGGGYINYYWQWKDSPQKVVPKTSYIKRFPAWDWIVGTGIYTDDIQKEIKLITQKFIRIFAGILIFIIILSIYISKQVFRIERKKELAEKEKELEELRLKKLFELSQMTEKSITTLTDFALEEAINLTQSEIGYLAFLNEDESQLTMHTWSRQVMKQCQVEDKILIYNVEETGLWAEAARSRKICIINDYVNFNTLPKKGFPQGHVKISRVMNVPIFDGDKMVALAGVGNKKEDYNESDVRQLQLMIDGMWKILQRKKAETRLKKSEERYRLLADNATDTIWIIQLSDFNYIYISPSIKSLQGYEPEEFIGSNVSDFLTEESLKDVSRIISEELDRESDSTADPDRSRVIELQMVKKDGSTVWVEITARFLRNDSGKPDRILGITRAINQRKMLEQELLTSNKNLRHAQHIAHIGNVFLDPEKHLPIWSEETYRIFELDLEQKPLLIADHQNILSPSDWEKFESAMRSAINDGLSFDIELKLLLPSEKKKWVNLICKPEQTRGPKGYCLHETMQDITERKTMELHIQQAQKMEALGTLAGGIAHDFNNILSSIFGFTELAKLNVLEDEGTIENLNQVLAAGLRAKELVKHILTFSRKSDAKKDLIQILPLVKECVRFLKASVSPDIKIQTNFIQTDSVVFADPTQLHQVLMNLFTNAAYAMKDNGGVLDVTVKSIDILKADILQLKEIKPGKYVQLTISDTGCGIPKNIIDKIFEPFFTTKVKGEGTGLGLSLTYGIIKEMQGNISVYSEPGIGSTFQILIPELIGEGVQNAPQNDGFLAKGKGSILIVDDDTAITKWTSQVLAALGYEVVSINQSQKALDIFNQNPMKFDLVLTDLTMPDMTGLELSSRISAKRPDLPIILCTGFSEGLTSQRIKNYGISDMIMKPMIASELVAIINKALAKQREQVL